MFGHVSGPLFHLIVTEIVTYVSVTNYLQDLILRLNLIFTILIKNFRIGTATYTTQLEYSEYCIQIYG